jgi:hypothetical protein
MSKLTSAEYPARVLTKRTEIVDAVDFGDLACELISERYAHGV